MKARTRRRLIFIERAAFLAGAIFVALGLAVGASTPDTTYAEPSVFEDNFCGPGWTHKDEDGPPWSLTTSNTFVRVGVKAGNACYKRSSNGVITIEDQDCYRVEGIGSSQVTVIQIEESSICQGISHIVAEEEVVSDTATSTSTAGVDTLTPTNTEAPASPTSTLTGTSSPSNTPSPTATQVAETPTDTPTATETDLPTATLTDTASPTVTSTPTEGPSPTATDTQDVPTPSPTGTSTATQSVTPTKTPTTTQTATSTGTTTGTPTATPTQGATLTSTATGVVESPTSTGTSEPPESPTPTNTQPPGTEPSSTPTTSPDELLIPVTGVEIPFASQISRRGYFGLAALFFGAGLILHGVARRRE